MTFCPDVRLRRDSFASTCIGALFKGLPQKNKLCGVKIRRAPELELKENGAGNLVVISASNKTAQWRVHCQGGKSDNFTLVRKGVTVIRVPEGCVAYGDEHAYQNLPRTVEFETVLQEVAQPGADLPAVLSLFDSWQHVAETFNSTISEADASEYHEASALADALARRKVEELEMHAGRVGSYGLGAGVAVVVLLAGVAVAVGLLCFRHNSGLGALRQTQDDNAVKWRDLEERAEAVEERAEAAEKRAAAAEDRAFSLEEELMARTTKVGATGKTAKKKISAASTVAASTANLAE